ncbi:unnamed protein product [Rhizophagus irregularis]|nr:unnamed protein product [Rhizophagus irregularis]
MESEYKITEYTYRFLKEAEKVFHSGTRSGENRPERATKGRKVSDKEEYFLESIRKDVIHRKETIKDIVLKCSDTSFKIYSEEIKRLSWENSKLRSELRKKEHVMDKKVNEEKKRERIISQKNEQIRKISQEAEKTRQELNMVKTGNNKEFDQQKKPKKSRSTSKKRNREAIIEIPILPEIPSDDRKNEKARDLFFYDIPKYWNQEEILAQLTILGRVLRLQIRGQYKYKTVKAKIVLNEIFEKKFNAGHFGICINKNFTRWYDASIGLKERQERDKWQTVRDLTNEEMESIKNTSSYDFITKLQQKSKAEFLKIIKITKNWKVIGYFKNQKAMEEAVEDSCTLGNISRIWLIRNKKTLYKDEKKSGKDKIEIMSKGNEEKEKTQPEMTTKKASEETPSSPKRPILEKLPMTPEERMYAELGNFASKNHEFFKDTHPREQQITFREHSPEKQKTRSPDEQKVVDMIKRWRIADEEECEAIFGKERQKEALKKDNVAPEEVVEIIKDYRSDKISYERLKDSAKGKDIRQKMDELKDIFDKTSNGMEWEKINVEAVTMMKDEMNIQGMENFNQWMQKENNYLRLGKKIISLAEQNEILLEYTTLNDDFTKRLKDNNRYQDEKEVGDKRPILDSPSPSTTKTVWLIDMSENEEDQEDEKKNEKEKDAEQSKATTTKNNTPDPNRKKKRKGRKKH